MNKLDFIEEYINRCDDILTANNYTAAKVWYYKLTENLEFVGVCNGFEIKRINS